MYVHQLWLALLNYAKLHDPVPALPHHQSWLHPLVLILLNPTQVTDPS